MFLADSFSLLASSREGDSRPLPTSHRPHHQDSRRQSRRCDRRRSLTCCLWSQQTGSVETAARVRVSTAVPHGGAPSAPHHHHRPKGAVRSPSQPPSRLYHRSQPARAHHEPARGCRVPGGQWTGWISRHTFAAPFVQWGNAPPFDLRSLRSRLARNTGIDPQTRRR